MKVLIAGCGWLGTAIGRRLAGSGHVVVGIRRSPRTIAELTAVGIPALPIDLAEPGAAARLPDDLEAIIACQSAAGRTSESYERAYVAANRTLLHYAASRNVRRLVYTGSTGVFGQHDGGKVDESTPVAPATETGGILARAERLVLDAGGAVSTAVVRLSGLYGPGRFAVVDRVRTGGMGLGPGDGIWMNFCHLEDAVRTVVAVLERGRRQTVYHASDSEPTRRRDVVRWIARRLGIPAPRSSGDRRGDGLPNRQVRADATRSELGLELAYPSFRDGLSWLGQS